MRACRLTKRLSVECGQARSEGYGAEQQKDDDRQPTAIVAERRDQQVPGDQVEGEGEQHHVAHIPCLGSADKDAVEQKAGKAGNRGKGDPP